MGTAVAPHRQGESMSLNHLGSWAYFPHFFSQKHQQREWEKCPCNSSVKTWPSWGAPRKLYSNWLLKTLLSVCAYLLKTLFSVTDQAQTYKQATVGWQVIVCLNTHCQWQMWANTYQFIQQLKRMLSNRNCFAFAIGQEHAIDRNRSQMCGSVITSYLQITSLCATALVQN